MNALFIAGDVLFEAGQAEDALTPLDELTRQRRIVEDHLLLAACQAALGRFDEAERTARVALEIDPFNPDTYELLSKLAHRRNDAPTAAAALRRKMEQLTPLAER